MSLKSATYYIRKAEETTNTEIAMMYAQMAQAEMLISIEYVLSKILKTMEVK